MGVVTFGNLVMDCILRVENIPDRDEKTFARSLAMHPGGPAVHFALMMNRLGRKAKVAGVTGDDGLGGELRRRLSGEGIGTELIRTLPGQTPLSVILIDPSGEKRVIIAPSRFRQEDVPPPSSLLACEAGSVQHLHTHLFLPEHVEAALRRAKAAGIGTSVDIEPSSARRWGPGRAKKALALADTVFINEAAVRLLFPGEPSLEDGIRSAAGLGAKTIVCTRGASGSLAMHGDTFFECGAFAVDAKNTLAAGDIFAAAFVHRLMAGGGAGDALRFASAASALAVGRDGDAPHYPPEGEINDFLRGRHANVQTHGVKP